MTTALATAPPFENEDTDVNPDQSQWFDTAFADQSTMIILRGLSPQETVMLCHRAWDLGISQVEVPIQTEDALPSLRAAIAAGRERGLGVGAGTVTTTQQLEAAADAGVTFTVAPGTSVEVLRWSAEHRLPHLPGVGTASEIQLALSWGARWLKAFPSSVLGPAWFRAMKAPFPQVSFVATGGMTVASMPDYTTAGARIIALGSALQDAAELDALSRHLGA